MPVGFDFEPGPLSPFPPCLRVPALSVSVVSNLWIPARGLTKIQNRSTRIFLMQRSWGLLAGLLILTAAVRVIELRADDPAASPEFFETKIRPVLATKCY